MITKSKPNVVLEAVIIRADGTSENLGVIASTKKGNLITNLFKKIFKNGE